jgi:hypothetical protein
VSPAGIGRQRKQPKPRPQLSKANLKEGIQSDESA